MQLDADKMQLIQELEIEMMADLYTRLTQTCYKKCIAPAYSESELVKGEAVCLDRCVAKFLDIHERIGKKLGQMTAQDQEAMLKK